MDYRSHKPEVVGSNPTSAICYKRGIIVKREDFIKHLSDLIRFYETNSREEIDLSFAFFDDISGKKYFWEENGFEYKEDFEKQLVERENEKIISLEEFKNSKK